MDQQLIPTTKMLVRLPLRVEVEGVIAEEVAVRDVVVDGVAAAVEARMREEEEEVALRDVKLYVEAEVDVVAAAAAVLVIMDCWNGLIRGKRTKRSRMSRIPRWKVLQSPRTSNFRFRSILKQRSRILLRNKLMMQLHQHQQQQSCSI